MISSSLIYTHLVAPSTPAYDALNDLDESLARLKALIAIDCRGLYRTTGQSVLSCVCVSVCVIVSVRHDGQDAGQV